MRFFRNTVLSAGASALALLVVPFGGAFAQVAPSTDLITEDVLGDVREMLAAPIIVQAIRHQNRLREDVQQAEIDQLDQTWRTEVDFDGAQPLIAAALGSPASTFLLREQASSKGLYNEIFIMDEHGLNVAQSSVTSDFWQGDEAKYQNTFPRGSGAVFVDEPEFNDEFGIWVTQINMTIDDNGTPVGVATIEINLTKLDRRRSNGVL